MARRGRAPEVLADQADAMQPPGGKTLVDGSIDGSNDERPPLAEPEAPPPRSGSVGTYAVAPDPEVGDIIGAEYELLELLGRGGAGAVFRAIKKSDGRVVALKVLASAKATRARVVQRFFDEARTASSVEHPSLVRFIEFIEEDDPLRLAYAMEFVDGEPLRAKLQREQSLHLHEAIGIARQICEGVEALHEAGIIHRDLKPENIMLVKGDQRESAPVVKILDFGVAKFLGTDRQEGAGTETPGTFVGTPRYMAPEQAAGGAVDARSDLFAIGVMLFEMITGSRPHEGDTLKAVVMAKLKGAPRLHVNPEQEILPQELADVVDACLKLQPDLRPKDARTVIKALMDAQCVLAAVGPIRLGERSRSSGVRAAVSGVGQAPAGAAAREVSAGEAIVPEAPIQRGAAGTKEVIGRGPRVRGHSDPGTYRAESTGGAAFAPPLEASKKPILLILVLAASVMAAAIGAYVFVIQGDDVSLQQGAQGISIDEPYDVLLQTVPTGADVSVNGKQVGSTPHRLRLDPGQQQLALELSIAGYTPRPVQISRKTRHELTIELDRDNSYTRPAAAAAPAEAASPAAEPAKAGPATGGTQAAPKQEASAKKAEPAVAPASAPAPEAAAAVPGALAPAAQKIRKPRAPRPPAPDEEEEEDEDEILLPEEF